MRLIKQMLLMSSRQDHLTNWKHYISTARVPTTSKLGRMVNYLDGLLDQKSHDPLIMWSCRVNTSPLPQYLWPQNFARWSLTLAAFTHKVKWSIITWFCQITWKIKNISPLTHNDYGHKIWQDGDLPSVTSTHKVSWQFNQVVF